MIAWLAAIWKAFLGTKVGRWIAGITLTLAALAAALFVAFTKGKHAQADEDEAKDAVEQAKQAEVAQQTYEAADDAAKQVLQKAANQPPPDPVKRDDFSSTF